MITIYCLVDPRNNKPFYVGATKIKLFARLCNHISEAREWSRHPEMYQHGPTRPKQLLIILLLFIDVKPEIKELARITAKEADHYEKFFHDMFIKQGFPMLQKPTAFHYYASYANPQPIRRKYWLPKKYNKIYFKDLLIIIW